MPGGVGDEGSGHHIPALRALASGLSRGADLRIFSLAPSPFAGTRGVCGEAPVEFLGAGGGGAFKAMRLAGAVRRAHHAAPFRLVHGVWALPAGLAAVAAGRLLGIPSVVTVQGGEAAALPTLRYGNMLAARTRIPTLWTCRNAGTLVTVSRHQAEALAALGAAPPRTRVIPYGSPHGTPPVQRTGPLPSPLRLLAVANIHPLKNHETLLRAFALIRRRLPALLRIAGPDQRGGELRKLAAELGVADALSWAGEVPPAEMPREYAAADMLLHASWHEAQPVVLAEAAAAGLLAAGSRVGLFADLSPGAVIAAPPGDHEALAAAVVDAAGDPARVASLRAALAAWAAEHTMEWTVASYLAIYREHARPR